VGRARRAPSRIISSLLAEIFRRSGLRSDTDDNTTPAMAAYVSETARVEIVDLVEHFYGVVARRPDAIALEALDTCLTYGELDAISNRLAHRLRSLGVDRDCRVGISLDRGPAELVALL